MTYKILVTYASRAGSTAGVAEAIGKTLAECGSAVEVRPMQDVTDLSSYSAVVAGSAIQRKRWLPEAMQFVDKFHKELAEKPFAIFLVCMTLGMKNEKWREKAGVENWLTNVRIEARPVSEGLFAGVLDISKVPSFFARLKFRISVWLGIWSEGDHRDWAAIDAWARRLAVTFGSQ